METGLRHLARWLSGIACIELLFIMVVTFVDVVGRFFFNAPLTFAVELVQLGMGLLVMFGLATTTLKRGHISVDLVEGLVQGRGKFLLTIIAAVCGLAFIALMAWRLWDRGLNFMSDGLATQVLFLPVYPVVLLMAIAAAIAAVIAALQVIKPSFTDRQDKE